MNYTKEDMLKLALKEGCGCIMNMNCPLHAAAPDMYKALRAILNDEDNGSFTTLAGSIRKLIKQALAKAEKEG